MYRTRSRSRAAPLDNARAAAPLDNARAAPLDNARSRPRTAPPDNPRLRKLARVGNAYFNGLPEDIDGSGTFGPEVLQEVDPQFEFETTETTYVAKVIEYEDSEDADGVHDEGQCSFCGVHRAGLLQTLHCIGRDMPTRECERCCQKRFAEAQRRMLCRHARTSRVGIFRSTGERYLQGVRYIDRYGQVIGADTVLAPLSPSSITPEMYGMIVTRLIEKCPIQTDDWALISGMQAGFTGMNVFSGIYTRPKKAEVARANWYAVTIVWFEKFGHLSGGKVCVSREAYNDNNGCRFVLGMDTTTLERVFELFNSLNGDLNAIRIAHTADGKHCVGLPLRK
jgi:hypothetical protein